MQNFLKHSFLLFIASTLLTSSHHALCMESESEDRSNHNRSEHRADTSLCPICQDEVNFEPKGKPSEQWSIMLTPCMHGIHLECAVLYILSHKKNHTLKTISCPLCRKLLDFKQLERLVPGIQDCRDQESSFFNSESADDALMRIFLMHAAEEALHRAPLFLVDRNGGLIDPFEILFPDTSSSDSDSDSDRPSNEIDYDDY